MTDEIAEVESPQTETADPADASTEEIRAALGLTPEPEASQEEATPDEVAQPEGEEPVDPFATAEEPSQVEDAEEQERLAKRRIRPRTAEDQQVIDLYRSEGFEGTFDDASRIIYGQQYQAPVQAPPADAPDPYAEQRAQAGHLQQEIAALESKVSEAAENLDTAEALTLQRNIMKKELHLQSLRDEYKRGMERQQEEQFNTHREKAMESRDRVYDMYPELADTNSVVRRQFDDYVSRAQQDSDYAAVFESPKWPELLAREFASYAQPQSAQLPGAAPVQAPPQQAPVMGNQARVLTSGTTAQPANSQPTAQQVVNNLPNLSREDLYAALGQPDGRRQLT